MSKERLLDELFDELWTADGVIVDVIKEEAE